VFSTDGLSDFHGRLDNHSSNLFAVRLDGSELTQVTSFPAGGSRAAQPTWSPDGKLIVFTLATGPNNDTAHIATIEADGTNLTDLAAPGTHNRL
jgi:Tol biopolymer transport system component